MTKSEQSKHAISDALLSLLKKVAYNKITVKAIVDEAGVSRMAFYRNYDSKEDILVQWIKRITDDFICDTRPCLKNAVSLCYFNKMAIAAM